MKKIAILITLAAAAVFASSCVDDDVYGLPTIAEVTNTIAYSAQDDVVVSATITSLTDVASATLYYKAGSAAYTSTAMTGSGKTYSATIPAYDVDTQVFYYIEATSGSGELVTSAVYDYTVGQTPVDYTGLRLNELNGNDKFIEIYNGSENTIYVGNIGVLKDEKDVWTCPEMNLEAGQYILLYSEDVAADHSEISSDMIFGSGLSAKKAVRVRLVDPNGNTLDDFNCTSHPGTTVQGSYGRNADLLWYIQTTPTPGSANVDGTESVEDWLTK